ncbi:MAG: GntR family transcriptional regulator [Candidatus Roseilinea sp.]|nr:MAG: GntR family transcriptional regulator [Candidatus Roseilinea sp.]
MRSTSHRASHALPAQIAERILAELIQRESRPGALLPSEGELANRFQVSRPVIREAIKQLEGQGLVEVINGRGSRVRPLSERQLRAYFTHAIAVERVPFRELMEARKPIEIQSARLAAQRRTPDQLDALRDIIQRMRRNIGNADVYVDLDHDLHALIADASGNLIIAHLVRAFRGALNDLTHEALYRRRNRQQLERVHVLHEAIVTEIGYRNSDGAGHAMDIHFSEALSFLIQRQEGGRR